MFAVQRNFCQLLYFFQRLGLESFHQGTRFRLGIKQSFKFIYWKLREGFLEREVSVKVIKSKWILLE